MRLDAHGTPAENLQRLITDCGVSPHKVQELVLELPPKDFADQVINWYFCHLNVVRYPIDERLLRMCRYFFQRGADTPQPTTTCTTSPSRSTRQTCRLSPWYLLCLRFLSA